jgi:hypothetical protein
VLGPRQLVKMLHFQIQMVISIQPQDLLDNRRRDGLAGGRGIKQSVIAKLFQTLAAAPQLAVADGEGSVDGKSKQLACLPK